MIMVWVFLAVGAGLHSKNVQLESVKSCLSWKMWIVTARIKCSGASSYIRSLSIDCRYILSLCPGRTDFWK